MLISILSIYLSFSIPPRNNAYYVPARIKQAKQTWRQVSMVDWLCWYSVMFNWGNSRRPLESKADTINWHQWNHFYIFLPWYLVVSRKTHMQMHFLKKSWGSTLKFMMLNLDLEQSVSSDYFILISIKQQLLCISCKF